MTRPKPAKTTELPPMMTVTEAARRSSCSEKTVRRAIDQDLLDVVRIGPGGRAIRITEAAFQRYLQRVTLSAQLSRNVQ